MPRALLLSPDDQAASAITGVLDEMAVTYERPLDGASAAKKLNSQNYDLVLVDCDNLPAAKLIFDVCRRSHLGTTPIAIVDGRAGLPTAFRLGAELILTKPVAKDQARISIRTAVSRLHKEELPRAPKPSDLAPAEPTVSAKQEPMRAAAAAAATGTAPPSLVAQPVAPLPGNVPAPAAPVAPAVTKPATISTTAEVSVTPAPAVQSGPALEPIQTAGPEKATLNSGATVRSKDTSATKMGPPVQARMAAVPKPAKPVPQKPDESQGAELQKAQPDLGTPIFASYAPPKKKGHGVLIAVLLLVLCGGGFYAAWRYQPQFRTIVHDQLQRANTLVGSVQGHKASAPQAILAQPKPKEQTNEAAPQTLGATPQMAPASANPTAVAASSSPSNPTSALPTPNEATDPAPSPAAAQPSSTVTPQGAAQPPTAELPGEKDAVILSSKGAEKRLIYHVAPTYPPQAGAQEEGTVILRALINKGGTIEGVRLVEGNPTLADAATKAVKQWRYRPYIRNGSPQPFTTVILVDFQQP